MTTFAQEARAHVERKAQVARQAALRVAVFLMTGMEIATAIKYGACPVILVFNNDKYGTIEMHQQRRYPGRELGNALTNPDFAAFARSFGAFGCRVRHADEFPDALEAALGAGRLALIELAMT